MRKEITSERAIGIGEATEAPDKFPDIKLNVDESSQEVWIQNPPTPGRGRPSPYVLGLEFIVRNLAVLLEAVLRNEKQLAAQVRRTRDTATDNARTARRENDRLKKENDELQKRVLDLEAQEARHGREMTAKERELSERAAQVQDAQAQTRLREEQHQEALDTMSKAHAEQLAGLRAEQEREIDQLTEGQRQIVEAMQKDAETVRNELQEAQDTNAELQEQNEALDSAKNAFQEAAEQSDVLLRVITSVTSLVGPARYVLFVDNEGRVVENQTYVSGKGEDADNVPSNVYIHGAYIGVTYKQGSPARMVAYPRSKGGSIVVQEIPLDEQGVPTLAGLVLLRFLKEIEVDPENETIQSLRDHAMFQRLIFGEPDNAGTDETLEEDSENEE